MTKKRMSGCGRDHTHHIGRDVVRLARQHPGWTWEQCVYEAERLWGHELLRREAKRYEDETCL